MTPGLAAGIYAGFAGLAVIFNLCLALGAPWGALAQGGAHPGRLPARNRIGAVLSAVLLGTMAAAVAARAGHGPDWPAWSAWAAMAMTTLALVLNLITPSRAERRLWAPVAAVMFASAALVLWSTA